jgi:hypothetical protein
VNRTRSRAAFGAAAVIATLLASGAGVAPALAATSGSHAAQHAVQASKDHGGKDKGDKGEKGKGKGKGGKSDTDKLAKAVGKLDEAFERLLARAEKKLGDESYARLAVNIEADRALLAQLPTVEDVRALQPKNYDQVINWLRKAERLTAKGDAQDPALGEAATALVEQLLGLSASSDKGEVRAAKHLLGDLKDLVEDGQAELGDDKGAGDESGTEDEAGEDESGELEGEELEGEELEGEELEGEELEGEELEAGETEAGDIDSGGHGRHGGDDAAHV